MKHSFSRNVGSLYRKAKKGGPVSGSWPSSAPCWIRQLQSDPPSSTYNQLNEKFRIGCMHPDSHNVQGPPFYS